MIRIAGINLPENKQLPFTLTRIKGLGKNNVIELIKTVHEKSVEKDSSFKISFEDFKKSKLGDLQEDTIVLIRNTIEEMFVTENDLRRLVLANIKRIVDIGTYRGSRHTKKLPARGQRTRVNSRTVRGKSGTSKVKKK